MDQTVWIIHEDFLIDPLAFVSMHYDAKKEDLYIFDEIYQQKLTNSRAAELIQQKAGSGRIIADSAEPKSIQEMRNMGLHVGGARRAATASNTASSGSRTGFISTSIKDAARTRTGSL